MLTTGSLLSMEALLPPSTNDFGQKHRNGTHLQVNLKNYSNEIEKFGTGSSPMPSSV